jgi:hypothetical protein
MNDIREQLKAFLDGELSAPEQEAVRQAVEADPQLQKECDQMRIISNQLKQLAAAPAPSNADAKEKLKVTKPQRATIWRKTWFVYAMAGCGCALLAAVLFPVFAHPKVAAKKTSAMMNAGSAAADKAPMTESMKDMAAPAESRASAPASASVAAPANRAVVKTVEIGVVVPDVTKTQIDIKQLAASVNGYVEQSTLQRNGTYSVTAAISIRVPSEKFDQTLEKVRAYGEVTSESSNGEDVTAQIVDMDARIAASKDQVNSLRELLRQSRKLGEIVDLRDRITQVQSEVDSMVSQQRLLKSQAAMSSMHINLEERQKPDASTGASKNWLDDTWAGAIQNLGAFGRVIGSLTVYVLVYSPIWLPIMVVAWILVRKNRAE